MNSKDLKSIAEGLIEIFQKAGNESIEIEKKGVKIKIKEDGSPVTNGDLKVNEIISKKIKQLTPDIPIISEETVNIKEKNKNTVFWLIDPIDGTKEYISGKDEYTLNAALVVDKKPIIGLVGVPKKKQLFYSYALGQSFIRQNGDDKKIDCKKKNNRNNIIAVSSMSKPPELIMKKLNEYNVSSIAKVASSYKFCLIADGTFDYDVFIILGGENDFKGATGSGVFTWNSAGNDPNDSSWGMAYGSSKMKIVLP